jgi:two-component sensor histidine kinase
VNIGSYLHELSCSLSDLYRGTSKVTIQVSAESLLCDIGTAIPLGLIANELITNSLKHAFPTGRNGRIDVLCRRLPATEQVEVAVIDDGVGFSSEHQASGSGLGTTLIKDLVAQVHGEIRLLGGMGTHTSIVLEARHFSVATEQEPRSRSIGRAVVSAGAQH